MSFSQWNMLFKLLKYVSLAREKIYSPLIFDSTDAEAIYL